MLSLFGMITRLPNNILHRVAITKLSSDPDTSTSWFIKIRHLCYKYSLPSPLVLLSSPPSKSTFKTLIRKKVLDFWQVEMRYEAKLKPSLTYFKPEFMSLQKPHPLWTTSGSNPFEINKALVVAKLMSGRYRTDWLARHWSKDNKSGFCVLCPGKNIVGSIEHLLVSCEALSEKRDALIKYWRQQTEDNFHLQTLFNSKLSSAESCLVQFVLDPSVVPEVIVGCQGKQFTLKEVFNLTKTFCYGLHRRRLQLTGRFNFGS